MNTKSYHYDETKSKYITSISFCAVCSYGKCAINRYIVHIFLGAINFIIVIKEIKWISINFTMLDYFREDEIIYFLETFTLPVEPYTEQNASFSWKNEAKFTWPRKVVDSVRLVNVVRRWNLQERRNYREDSWNGLLHRWMFEKIAKAFFQI